MKNLYLDVKTLRGKERTISCGYSVKISIYPEKYDEDFTEFPVDLLLVNDVKRGPSLHILKGKCTVVNHTENVKS